MKTWMLPALLAFGGCSLAPGGSVIQDAAFRAVETGIEDRKAYNDAKAEVLPALACDISIGAYGRLPEGDVKRGIALICGLAGGAAVAADLAAARELMQALGLLPAVPTQ